MDRPCPFITFYSFKGGVGRSMAVINVAGILAARGFRVLVIDMDLEAPGISYLANEATRDQERAQPGFVDLLLEAVEHDADADLFKLPPDQTLDRYAAAYPIPDTFLKAPGGSLHIMPAGRLDAEYPARLDNLDLPSLYREGSGLALIKIFKDVVQQSRRFDYVFIDSRTGFSDESGICTRDLADYLMVVSGLNRQNVEGTTQFLAALAAASPERKPLAMILSPVPNGEDALVDLREQAAQRAFTAAWGSDVQTGLHIPYHPQLALTEEPHIFRRGKGYLFDAYCQIERHLLSMLGETADARTEAAIAALNDKDYSGAAALLRRACMVADTNEWVDKFAFALNGTDPLPGVRDAKAVYDILVDRASHPALHFIADRAERRAISLWQDERQIDAADAMFELALKLGPADARRLGNYAHFIRFARKDLDAAAAMYRRALDVSPKNAHNLGNYASFLRIERKDLDAAEEMYKRALDADPKHANNLGNYANFLLFERRDLDAAEAMYQRTLDADPKNAHFLGDYAHFLQDERRDLDAAEAMYRRALYVDPKHANNLGNYGRFCTERKDLDAAETMYERALDVDPKHANNLGNYAHFLHFERKDLDAAETMYRRALDVDPKHANNLGNYASFLHFERRDLDAAEAMYKRALDADPKHANNFGNFGRFFIEAGRIGEGMDLVDRAIALLRAGSPREIDAECWMYVYCCGAPARRAAALTRLRQLVELHAVKTGAWDFSGVIRQAQDTQHPEAAWLPVLAEVLAGRQPPTALADWAAWVAAG